MSILFNVRDYRIKPKGSITAKKKKATIRLAIENYSEAYSKLYGVAPTVSHDGQYFRIVGNAQGVTLERFKAMTTQLKRRL